MVRWICTLGFMFRYCDHSWFQLEGKKILFTTTCNQFMSPSWLQRRPTDQMRFLTWLKAFSEALMFKGIQIPLSNQKSKKVETLRERFWIYARALGYFSCGKAWISSAKPCFVFSTQAFTFSKSWGVRGSKSSRVSCMAGMDLSLSLNSFCCGFFKFSR